MKVTWMHKIAFGSTLSIFGVAYTIASADELLSINHQSAGADWYLAKNSVAQLPEDDLVFAVHYFSMYKPRNTIAKFDDEGGYVGEERINPFQSYAFGEVFDCENELMGSVWINYYSTEFPDSSQVVRSEGLGRWLHIVDQPILFSRVCRIAHDRFK